MTSIRCMFRPHKWVFIGNIVGDVGVNVQREIVSHRYGLYQCSRCKELSVGSLDGPHGKCEVCGAKTDEPCDAGLHG